MSEIFSHSVHLPPVFLLLEALALVEEFLSLGQGDVHLCPSVLVDEDQDGDDGEAHLLHRLGQPVDLAPVEQQLAVAPGLVVAIRPIEIGRHVHSLDPHLAIDDGAVGIHKRCLTKSDGLDLGAGEHDARRIGLDEEILE